MLEPSAISSYSVAFVGEPSIERQYIIQAIAADDDDRGDDGRDGGDDGEHGSGIILPPREFNVDVGDSRINLSLMDTEWGKNDAVNVAQSNLLVLVFKNGSSDSGDHYEEWIQRAFDAKKPFLIVRVIEEGSEPIQPLLELFPVLKGAAPFVGCIDYSWEEEDSAEALVFKICDACLHPVVPLFDLDTQTISVRSVVALKRVFWIVDSDKDGFWNTLELDRFLGLCDERFKSLDSVNAFIAQEDESFVHESGVTFEGLVAFVSQLVKHQSASLVWNIFRSFNYDEGLNLDIEDLLHGHVPKCTEEEIVVLSDQGTRVLLDLFKKFDRNGDGLLDTMEIEEAFSIAAENPFEQLSANYMDMCETRKRMMTPNSWISLWSLLTLRDPFTLLRTLVYWGIRKNVGKVLTVKKKRSFRDIDNAQGSSDVPTTLQCYIFGAPCSGKTSLMKSFIQQPFNTTYTRTEDQYSVANRITFEDTEYSLVITEFEYGQVQTVLASEELMAKCDVCVLCFDGNDKYSFSTVAFVQRVLPRDMPVVYVLTKSDLEIVDQEFEVTPQEFCQELQLPWPCIVSSLVKDDATKRHKIFQEIVASAIYPDIALPDFGSDNEGDESDEDDDNDDDDEFDGKKSRGKTLIKAAIAIGSVALVGVVAWRFWKQSKNNQS